MKDRTRAALLLLNEGWTIDEVNAVLKPEQPQMVFNYSAPSVDAPPPPVSPSGHWQKLDGGTGGIPTWVWVEDQNLVFTPVQ